MRNLMMEAGFPEDVIKRIEGQIETLTKEGRFSIVEQMADKIMEEPSDNQLLVKTLEQAEGLEEEWGVHKYTLDLMVLLACWKQLRTRYEAKGISMEIFRDTLADLCCKLRECQDVYGVDGVFVGFWYSGFFDMTRFALGRLQFEMMTYPFEIPFAQNGVTVKKGDPVINMHIPSSGPLTKEAADHSFALAAEFFKKERNDGPAVFVMDSWLLDPKLMEILPEGNVKDFVHRFTVLESHCGETFGDAWRVFGKEHEKAPEDLPRCTRLQKSIADALQQGQIFGAGYGIFTQA